MDKSQSYAGEKKADVSHMYILYDSTYTKFKKGQN